MIEFVAFGRIEKTVWRSEKTLLDNAILRRVAVGTFSEISQMHSYSSIDCSTQEVPDFAQEFTRPLDLGTVTALVEHYQLRAGDRFVVHFAGPQR